jgi:Flp pilus assembly protein TadG
MPTMQSSIMRRLIGRIRAVSKDRRAAAAVELALAMPALCLFIFGIIEVGFALWVQNALDYSVANAARCASINGSACQPVGGSSQVTTYAANQSGANVTSQPSPTLLEQPAVAGLPRVTRSRSTSPGTALSR